MKFLQITLILPALLSVVSCSIVTHPLQLEQSSPDLSGVRKLEIQMSDGYIKVRRGDAADLKLLKRGPVNVKVERVGSTFRIQALPTTWRCLNCTASVEFVIPQALELQLSTADGDIDVLGKMTQVQANSSDGTLTITDTESDLNLMTSDGGINLRNTGSVVARTSDGSVHVTGMQGRADIATSDGSVTLENALLVANSHNVVQTHDGTIDVRDVNAPNGFVIVGHADSGKATFGLAGFDLQSRQGYFTATRAGQDSTALTLRTDDGDIRVRP